MTQYNTREECLLVLALLLAQNIRTGHQQQCPQQQQQQPNHNRQYRKQCQHLSSVESSDASLFHIIGFVPVVNEYPGELIDNGVMRSEVIRYTVKKFNEKYRRKIIGYAHGLLSKFSNFSKCQPEFERLANIFFI